MNGLRLARFSEHGNGSGPPEVFARFPPLPLSGLFCTTHLLRNALVDHLRALIERQALGSVLCFHPALLSGFRLGEWRGCRFHCWRASTVGSATGKHHCREHQEAQTGNVDASDSRVVHREYRPEVSATETLAILGTTRKAYRMASALRLPPPWMDEWILPPCGHVHRL